MIPLEQCFLIPASAPSLEKAPKSKSKKVFKLKDEWFFIGEANGSTKLFSIRLGVQLAFFGHQDKDRIFKWILSKMEEIKSVSNEFN